MDTVLRGATLVDGSGAPGRDVDVAVEQGRIAAVGSVRHSDIGDAEVVDLDGLTLAPGFIDVHTHYDAQVLWDADLTPSSWHGVTTVVFGNCGFGIAPARAENRDSIVRMLENVEGMSAEALTAGIDWEFETFPEYLDVLDQRAKRCNIGAMLGHSVLRQYVMGDESMERAASADEVHEQRSLLEEALSAGALGFSSSAASVHIGDGGRPVPSRLAEPAEVAEICRALQSEGHGVLEFTAGSTFGHAELVDLSKEIERPVILAGILSGFHGDEKATRVFDRLMRLGGQIWPAVACREVVFVITMADPFNFANSLRSFERVLSVPHSERAGIYADPAWRVQAVAEAAQSAEWQQRWQKMSIVETRVHTDLLEGPTIAELADIRGIDPLELVIDLALADNLETRFRVVVFNDDEAEVASLLRDPRSLISLSDAGAHASQICDADFSTHLLAHWVRELGVLSLPQAVNRLSAHPAAIFGLSDRGIVKPGYWADLIAFDPETIGSERQERVWDLPAGADRLITRSKGVSGVWVNGIATRLDGKDIQDSRPGVLIRGKA